MSNNSADTINNIVTGISADEDTASNQTNIGQIVSLMQINSTVGISIVNSLISSSSDTAAIAVDNIIQSSIKNSDPISTSNLIVNTAVQKAAPKIITSVSNAILSMSTVPTVLINSIFSSSPTVGQNIFTNIYSNNTVLSRNIIKTCLSQMSDTSIPAQGLINTLQNDNNSDNVDSFIGALSSDITADKFDSLKGYTDAFTNIATSLYYSQISEGKLNLSTAATTTLNNVFSVYQNYLTSSGPTTDFVKLSKSYKTLGMMCSSGLSTDPTIQGYKSQCLNLLTNVNATNWQNKNDSLGVLSVIVQASLTNSPNISTADSSKLITYYNAVKNQYLVNANSTTQSYYSMGLGVNSVLNPIANNPSNLDITPKNSTGVSANISVSGAPAGVFIDTTIIKKNYDLVPNKNNNTTLISDVLQISSYDSNFANLNLAGTATLSVNLQFNVNPSDAPVGQKVVCMYLSDPASSNWTTFAVSSTNGNSSVTCTANHLTYFTVSYGNVTNISAGILHFGLLSLLALLLILVLI